MSRMMSRSLGLGLASLVLAACGDDGATTVTASGASDSATSDETGEETTPTTTPTTQTSQTSQTTMEPTGGSESMTGAESSGSSSTGTATDGDTSDDSSGSTAGISATEPDTDTPPECGNGVQEGNELCDDGNQDDGDGCENTCVPTAVCGNEVVDPGEACDDGNTVDGDECSADCLTPTPAAVCGDGNVQDPETCDDGNTDDGDGCQADCTITPAECGNMLVEDGEQCDDGNEVNGGPGDFCKNDCTVFVPATCNAPADYAICDNALDLANKADKTQAHKAMGICNGAPADSVQISDWSFNATDNASWQIAKGFGTYKYDHDNDPVTPTQLLYSPREGDTMLMISTGLITAPNAQGIVVQPVNSQAGVGTNNNPGDPNTMPAPMFPIDGSNNGQGGTPFMGCDGVNDCSDTLQFQWNEVATANPEDKLWFTFKTKVPEGTFGYTFDFVFCSAEWPSFVDTQWNDLLVAWQTDPTPDAPMADPPIDAYTGNVTFIPDPNDPTKGLPLTITALDPYYLGPGFTNAEPQLQGTGFEDHACTEWFKAKGGVQPGADLTIGFFITDMGDTIYTSTALLDNFRWDCKGCVPSEVDDCGIQGPM